MKNFDPDKNFWHRIILVTFLFGVVIPSPFILFYFLAPLINK